MTLEPQRILEDVRSRISSKQYERLTDLVNRPKQHLIRIPLLLPLVASFGLVATFYGFEKLLDQSRLINQPILMVIIGILLLLLTGAAARKL